MEPSGIYDQLKFNELVLQTMDDFELSIEEAIPSAVDELKAQNVSTSFLITDVNVIQGVDPITQFRKKYSDIRETDDLDLEEFKKSLLQISDITSNDTKYQMYSGKLKINEILQNVCKWKVENLSTLEMTLTALKTMATGYPDLIDEKFMNFLIDLLEIHVGSNSNLGKLLWTTLLESIKQHELNKESLFKSSKFPLLLKQCLKEQTCEHFITCCSILEHLCKDDDIRQHISRAHIRATTLADDFLLQLYPSLRLWLPRDIIFALSKAVTGMIVTDELVCKVHKDDPSFQVVKDFMEWHGDDQEMLVSAARLIMNLSGNDDCRNKLSYCIQFVVQAIDDHISCPGVVRAMFLVSSSLALRSKANAIKFIKLNAVDKIIQGMKVHNLLKLRQYGLMAIRNIASSTRNPAPFLEAGVVEYVNYLIVSPSQSYLTQECKSVLIALGATVSLTERWTGERGDIVGENEKRKGDGDC